MARSDKNPPDEAGEKTSVNATDAIAAAAPTKKSWGEKYGRGTFEFTRDWSINYFINFVLGAIFAYKFDTSEAGVWTKNKLNQLSGMDKVLEAEARGETVIQKGIWTPSTKRYVLNIITRNQFLLMGGHILLPVMKVMRQHENQIVFWSQHQLDKLQELTGNGNEASKRNLADYKHVSGLRAAAKHGAMPALSDGDKEILARHHVDEKGQYQEKHESWWRMIKARAIGITCSTAAAGGLGWLSGQKAVPVLQYQRLMEKPFGRWAATHVIGRVPFLRTFFTKEPTLIGEYFIADAILTVVSAGVYRLVEKHDEQRALEKEKAQKAMKSEQKTDATAEGKANPVVQQVRLDGPITSASLTHAVK